MKILSQEVFLSKAKLVFVVEPDDIGKKFTCTAIMIPYSCGGGAMSHIGLDGDNVRIGYKVIVEEEPCFMCDGTGTFQYEDNVGLRGIFGKKTVISAKCRECYGTGKRERRREVPLADS